MPSFRIELQDANGTPGHVIYETDPCGLFDMNGERVSLVRIGRDYSTWERPDRHPIRPDSPGKKIHRISRLKIQLGLGCNYACSYCLQASQIGGAERTLTHDAYRFVDSVGQWLDGSPDKIEFWGGEPLLYWPKIQILAPKLRAKYPNSQMLIITNGSLITDEMIDFFYANSIRIAVSHDGPGQHLRGPDPFDNPHQAEILRNLFDRLGGNACFNAVITTANMHIKKLMDFFTDKIGYTVTVNLEGAVNAYDGAQNVSFNQAQHSRMSREVHDRIMDGTALDVPQLRKSMDMFFSSLQYGYTQRSSGQKCNMDAEDFITVDLAGNVLTCQNTGAKDHKIGSIHDFSNIRLDTAIHFSHRWYCHGCPVLHLCYGSCMYLTGQEFDISCDNSYWFNLAIMFAAIEIVTGKTVTSIDYIKPHRAKVVIPIAQVE